MLRLCLWPVEVAYAYARMGDDFDRMYPSRGTKPYVREKLDYLRVASTRENHSDERPTFTRTVRPHPPAVSRAAISK
jgi:hypothetical protein